VRISKWDKKEIITYYVNMNKPSTKTKNGVSNVTPCGSSKNDNSEERIASIIRVTRIGELATTLAVTRD
jgi:hypothetical protein